MEEKQLTSRELEEQANALLAEADFEEIKLPKKAKKAAAAKKANEDTAQAEKPAEKYPPLDEKLVASLPAATRIQDIAQTLVDRFHLPCEYAFMLTTALRFVPNFLADSEITLDAQSCRGYSNRGNCVKRLLSYVVVIRPLVMRAVAKSETLALSMELKGFGSNTYKNMPREPLGAADFIVLGLVVVLSTYPFWK